MAHGGKLLGLRVARVRCIVDGIDGPNPNVAIWKVNVSIGAGSQTIICEWRVD